MKQKRFFLVLVAVLGMVVVAGCSSPQAQSTQPAATPAAKATTVTSATSPAAGGIPQISAAHQPIEQRKDCLACHKQGGFMPAPASHAGRTNDTCTSCHQAAPAAKPPVESLVAAKVDKAPTLDGTVEDTWSKAKALTVHVNGGMNKSETDVTLKALYDNDNVYFLMQYKDPTQSLERQPWQMQQDGTWKQLPANPNYEDKAAFIWDIASSSMKGFSEQGCAVTCHATTAGKDRPLKYTNSASEFGDIWHMKTVRTLPVGQIDDQYLDGDTKANEAGRKSDPKTSGGYADNKKEGQSTPPFALPGNKPAPPFWILDSEKVAFDASKYKAGDKVPGIVTAPAVGDRGDITAKGGWKDGVWTFEISRKLTTSGKYDVQFSDLKKEYFTGVAIFDNAQIAHAVQYGVTKFTFE